MSLAAAGRSRRAPLALVLASCLSLAALAAPAAADVVVVDPSGGGDTTDLSDAIANAASGDILILMPADYTVFAPFLDFEDKALVMAGAPGGTVTLPPLFVRSVPAGGTVVLRHLTFQPNAFASLGGATVQIEQCAGSVHIEDCTLIGKAGGPSLGFATPGLNGLRLSANTGAVALHRSTVTGGNGQATISHLPFPIATPSVGGSAIWMQGGGRLALCAVTATGGKGGDALDLPATGAIGGDGLTAFDAQVILSGATLQGGDGGAGVLASGASGHGLALNGASSTLRELDSTLAGGAGAPPLLFGGSEHVLWPGQAWQLVLGSPLASGELGSIAVSGPPNCLFGLFVSGSMGYQPIDKFKGPFLPGAPFFGPQFIASTNGSGTFAANFLAPSLVPFGLEGLAHVDQALMVQPGDGPVLGSATAYIQYQP